MLVYVTDNQRCCNATWDMLDVWLCWSLEELQQGVWSGTDPWQRPLESRKHKAGLPIACGWKAVSSDEFANGCRYNPWTNLSGWHIEVVSGDWLHVVDLTLVPEAAASVARSCVRESVWHAEGNVWTRCTSCGRQNPPA
ncbi:unnamed protein product [Durusdinium trenchii]|uniref:Uncharacterized protein n=1 Tax=Durusdinium trenchii TaxID=1381693 RepID=A0ABP0NC70_9DINO